MEAHTSTDDLPPLGPGGTIPHSVPVGTIVDRWDCPCCERVIDVVHRAGRPRIYCSPACRQRAYRWRQQHGVHTASTPAWPAEHAAVHGGRDHALRTDRDPMSRRRDRRGREVTACGALAHPSGRARTNGHRAPFLGDASPRGCLACAALTVPRPLGLVPPGAMPSTHDRTPDLAATVRALHAIRDDYPLDPRMRRLLATAWAA